MPIYQRAGTSTLSAVVGQIAELPEASQEGRSD